LLAGVLDHAAVLDTGERHLELHLSREHLQREAGAVARLTPARLAIEAEQPRRARARLTDPGHQVPAMCVAKWTGDRQVAETSERSGSSIGARASS
jgi:hypothetical protein